MTDENEDQSRKRPVIRKRIGLGQVDGVQVERKFATARVIKWGVMFYLFYLLNTCMFNPAAQRSRQAQLQPKGGVATYKTLEEALPSGIAHYSYSELDIKKKLRGNAEVYKQGVGLGVLASVYVLESNGDVIGYLNNAGIFDKLGRKVGNVSKDGVYDPSGKMLGKLKGDKTLQGIIDESGTEKAKTSSEVYVIMGKDNKGGYMITGIVDDLERYFQEQNKNGL